MPGSPLQSEPLPPPCVRKTRWTRPAAPMTAPAPLAAGRTQGSRSPRRSPGVHLTAAPEASANSFPRCPGPGGRENPANRGRPSQHPSWVKETLSGASCTSKHQLPSAPAKCGPKSTLPQPKEGRKGRKEKPEGRGRGCPGRPFGSCKQEAPVCPGGAEHPPNNRSFCGRGSITQGPLQG